MWVMLVRKGYCTHVLRTSGYFFVSIILLFSLNQKTTTWSFFFIYISKKLIVWQNNTNEHIRHYSIIVSTVGEQHCFHGKLYIFKQEQQAISAKRSKTIYCISSNSPLRISPSYECTYLLISSFNNKKCNAYFFL